MNTINKRNIKGAWYYRQALTHPTKEGANKYAKRGREQGLKVRVIKISKGFSLYARSKKVD